MKTSAALHESVLSCPNKNYDSGLLDSLQQRKRKSIDVYNGISHITASKQQNWAQREWLLITKNKNNRAWWWAFPFFSLSLSLSINSEPTAIAIERFELQYYQGEKSGFYKKLGAFLKRIVLSCTARLERVERNFCRFCLSYCLIVIVVFSEAGAVISFESNGGV